MFPKISGELLTTWGLRAPEQAERHLQKIARLDFSAEMLQQLGDQLAAHLPTAEDPDRVVADLATLIGLLSETESFHRQLKSTSSVLINLVSVLSISRQLSGQLLSDPEMVCLVASAENNYHNFSQLTDKIVESIQPFQKDSAKVTTQLERWKNRGLFQIAYSELIFNPRIEVVSQQITALYESILKATLQWALNKQEDCWGIPRSTQGERVRFAVIGMGKLGGRELSYSNDLEMLCIYDEEGKTDGSRSQSNQFFFDAVAADLAKILGGKRETEPIFQIDYRLRPGGLDAPLATTVDQARRHYDLAGRTWERQAFVKSRSVAGDLVLGEQFLSQMMPWVYRRYLTMAEITEIKALKRRIEQLSRTAGEESLDVETGHGGIRDIEFMIQFLQLLNGGDLPSVRVPNTLEAIEQLATAGCLSSQEHLLLCENYRFLRKLEHRLQLIFGMQMHRLPRDEKERKNLAGQLGYSLDNRAESESHFKNAYQKITAENRRVLDHLLHDAFADDAPPAPEVDLILDPHPSLEKINRVLQQYTFKDPALAYRHLLQLAQESAPFLSTRRCRYFLAAIARDLLTELSRLPDPDSTLVNLCRTSDSLGGKGALWELFSFNRPSLTLYVNLCAMSPYLSNILIRNPGMIDELMDGLMLEKLPEVQQQEIALAELCRAAENIDPIIQSFNHAQTLRVGVREIVGKESVEATNGALSDIADICLRQWARVEYSALVKRLGEPVIAVGPRAGHIAEFVVLAVGKYGGREVGYNGNLELVFLYEADGGTQHRRSERKKQQVTSNQHFFGELSQRIVKRAGPQGSSGRLYQIDTPMRFASHGTALAVSLNGLQNYFLQEGVLLRDRLALCRARVVIGNEIICHQAMESVRHIIFGEGWKENDTEELIQLREQLESAASAEDLEDGNGGVLDIEFIVQIFLLRYAATRPALRQPNTMAALLALREEELLEEQDYRVLSKNYRLFRALESRLQGMEGIASTILPEGDRLTKLALMMGLGKADELQQACKEARGENRALFDKFLRRVALTS